VLRQGHGGFDIRIDGQELMTSRGHHSEMEMARRAVAALPATASPAVLVGGLGFGFTLRAALDALPPTGSVVVAELVPELVGWIRGVLAPLALRPLDDPRVSVEIGDVAALIAASPARFDVILLDVDNGPDWVTRAENESLYGPASLERMHRALRPGGILAVWSSEPSAAFIARLEAAGFRAGSETVRALGPDEGPEHTIFLARWA
jgi:spermidine synthase